MCVYNWALKSQIKPSHYNIKIHRSHVNILIYLSELMVNLNVL